MSNLKSKPLYFTLNGEALDAPLFTEPGKTSMVWWMLVADVSPSHGDTLGRVRAASGLVDKNWKGSFPMHFNILLPCPSGSCRFMCLRGVLRGGRVQGWIPLRGSALCNMRTEEISTGTEGLKTIPCFCPVLMFERKDAPAIGKAKRNNQSARERSLHYSCLQVLTCELASRGRLCDWCLLICLFAAKVCWTKYNKTCLM